MILSERSWARLGALSMENSALKKYASEFWGWEDAINEAEKIKESTNHKIRSGKYTSRKIKLNLL